MSLAWYVEEEGQGANGKGLFTFVLKPSIQGFFILLILIMKQDKENDF